MTGNAYIECMQNSAPAASFMVVNSRLGNRKLHTVTAIPVGSSDTRLRFRVANSGKRTEAQAIDFVLDYALAKSLRDALTMVIDTVKEAN